MQEKEFLNSEEIGEVIGRTPAAVRNLVKRRKIPFRKPAGRLIFLRSEIQAWIENAEGLHLEEINDPE